MNRSCEYCSMSYEQEGLIGTTLMCIIEDKQVEPANYCENFRLKKQ